MVDGEDFKLPEGIKDPSLEFDLQDSLGKGSFGAVYKAVHKKSGHEVAIKQVLVNDDFMEILKEINFMKQCRSKYVVQYYGNYFKGDQCWIVMEYCASGSVGDILALVDTAMQEEQIALVCRSTLKGLYYLHKSNKIHRDIKPGNILVNSNGECKLADFGVSGQLSERTRKRNTVIGTPFFLAPEVIQEVGYDSKADIWALGITAIEMAEKHPPYYDVHPMRVLFLIPTSTPPTLKEQDKWSPEFHDFLRCCLNKDPGQRWSAKQLLKHPFIDKGRDGGVMTPIIDAAQNVINAHGGSRLQALKEIQKKKMGGRDSDDESDGSPRKGHESPSSSDDDSDSISDSDDSSDDERKKPVKPAKSKANSSVDELDNILSGILSKTSEPKADKPKQQPQQAKPQEKPKAQPVQAPPQPAAAPSHEDELEALLSGLQAKAKSKEHTSTTGGSPTASPRLDRNHSPSNSSTSLSTPAKSTPTPMRLGAVPRGLSSGSLSARASGSGTTVTGSWTASNSGGCTNSPSWRNNPQYLFTVTSSTSVRVTLSQSEPYNAIGFYVAKAAADKSKVLSLGKENAVAGSEVGYQKAKYVTVEFKVDAGDYVVVPTTFTPGETGGFELEVTGCTSLQQITKSTHEATSSGEWKGNSAGGCYSGPSTTWRNNPKFLLSLANTTNVTITLTKAEPVVSSTFVGFYVFKAGGASPTGSLLASNLATKTNFVNGLEVVHVAELPAGKYVILPCTYDVGQEGKFTLSVYSTSVVKLTKPEERAAFVNGQWKGVSAGGCLNHPTWRANPQYYLTTSKPSTVTIMLEQTAVGDSPLPFVGFYVLQAQERKKLFILVTKDVLSNTEFINDVQVVQTIQVDGPTIILPATFTPGIEGNYTLRVCNEDGDLSLTELPNWEVAKVTGEWRGTSAGGRYSTTSSAWTNNPRFEIIPTTSAATRIAVVLAQSEKPTLLGIGFYIFKRLPDNTLKSVLGKSGFVSGKEVAMELTLAQGESAVVLPATFEPGQNDTFSVVLYSDQRCAFV